MRKLSELYQVVLDKFYKLEPYGICGRINELACKKSISTFEKELILSHFKCGKHKIPKRKRMGYWFNSSEERIEYLKYLIELCKEQDI